MRCQACDELLSDREATRKFTTIQERAPEQQFVDLCDKCFDTIRDSIETDDNQLDSTSGDDSL